MPKWKQKLLSRIQEPTTDGASGGDGAGGADFVGEDDDEGDGKTGGASDSADDATTDDAKGKDGKDAKGKDGKSSLSDADANLVKENTKTKRKNQELQATVADLQTKLQAFDGIDVEAVRTLLAERKTVEEQQLEQKGEWQTLKQRMATEHTTEKTALQTQLSERDGTIANLQKTIEELSLGNLFAHSKYVTEETVYTPRKARQLYGAHFDVVEGQVVGFDKPRGEKGRTQLVDAQGNPFPFEEAMKRIVDADPDADSIKRSKMRQGAGSASNKSAGAKTTQAQNEGEGDPLVSGVDRIAAALAGMKNPLITAPSGFKLG